MNAARPGLAMPMKAWLTGQALLRKAWRHAGCKKRFYASPPGTVRDH